MYRSDLLGVVHATVIPMNKERLDIGVGLLPGQLRLNASPTLLG
jgi:hypothetical protein